MSFRVSDLVAQGIIQGDSAYANIFYDSANTAFYLDPAGTSILNGLTVGGSSVVTNNGGTWNINISGSANTLDGLDSADFMRNYGMLNNTDVYVNFRVMRNSNSSSANDGMYIGYGNTGGGLTRIFGGGATTGELIKYSNYTYEPGSFRAPIFYDSENTAYYVDPAGTSNLNGLTVVGGAIITGPNAWNAATPVLNVGGTGDGRIQVRHIYGKSSTSASADHLWLQYQNTGNHVQVGDSGGGNNLYVSGNIFMNGYFGGNLVATQSWVSSQGYVTGGPYLPLSGGTMTGDITMSGNNRGIYFTGGNNRIYFSGYRALEGSTTGSNLQVGEGYSQTQIQSATTRIDGSLVLSTADLDVRTNRGRFQVYNNAGTGNLGYRVRTDENGGWRWQFVDGGNSEYFGVAYSSGNVSAIGNFTTTAASSRFGNVLVGDGTYKNTITPISDTNLNISTPSGAVYFDTYGIATGSFRAPIFYDSQNTNYYLDPNGQSELIRIRTNTNWYDNSATDWGGGVNMSGNNPSIGFQPTSSSWWYMLHHSTYMNFYRRNTSGNWNQDGIWDTSGNLYWNNGIIQSNVSMRAPIFYDSQDTSFYLDPAGSSFLNTVSLGNQTWRGNITWNNAVNVFVSGESSFDLTSGGQWGVWESQTSNFWMRASWGDHLRLVENGKNVIVSGSRLFNDSNQQAVFNNGGTWGINISGNAATASNANLLGGNGPSYYYPANTPNGYAAGDINGNTTHQRLWGTDSVQNLLAFRPPTSIEYSTNGSTWVSTSATDGLWDNKIFGKWGGFNMNVGNNIGGWRYVRMTWVNFGYHFFSNFTLAHSTNGHSFNFVFYKSDLNGNFGAEAFRMNGISSWPGYTFVKYSDVSGWWDTRDVRMVFELNYNSTYPDNAISIGHIGLMGSYSGFTRLYDWDGSRNMYFANNATASASFRAPIFYDSENTNFYLDPASTSVLNGLTVGGSSVVTNNGGTWSINITGQSSTTNVVNAARYVNNDFNTLGNLGNGFRAYSNYIPSGGSYNQPPNGSGDYRVYQISSPESAGNWGGQLVQNFYTDQMWFRRQQGSSWQAWRELIHDGNYSSWAIARGGDTVDGIIYYRTNQGAYLGSLSGAKLQVYNDNNQSAFMSFHRSNQYAVNFGLDQDNVMRIGGWSASANRWELDMSGNNTVAGSFRAPIFYDSQNTSYYLDPNATTSIRTVGSWRSDSSAWDGDFSGKIQYHANHWYIQGADLLIYRNASGSNVFNVNQSGSGYFAGTLTTGNQIYINNGDPTIFLQDSNHRSSMIHCNSNRFYILRGSGTNSTVWSTYNGYWPLEIHLEDNNATFGGTVSAPVGDFRAPIFYDSNDTTYYLDPNSLSNLRNITVNHTYGSSILENGHGLVINGNYTNGQYSHRFRKWDDGGGVPLYMQFTSGTANSWSNLVRFGPWSSDGSYFRVFGSVLADSTITSSSDMRAPIFYDSQDTTYYADFASTGIAIQARGLIRTWGGNSGSGAGWDAAIEIGETSAGTVNGSFPTYITGYGVNIRKNSDGCFLGLVTYDGGSNYHSVIGWGDDSGEQLQFRFNNGVVASMDYVGNYTANSSLRAPIFYDSNDTTYYADFNNTGRSMYTAGYLQSDRMIMKGSSGGGQIYPTIAYGGMSMYGGDSLTNGAWITVTGISYGSSPGAGSAEIIVRSEASSKLAMFSFNGSTYTGRAALWGSNGNFVIGSATVDYGYKLYVDGTIYATGNVIAYSDESVKTNVREIENPLARVLNTRGVIYDRIDNEDKDNIGFIAQELEKEFPELVSTGNNGKKGVMYQNMVAVLIEAMKEQNKEIQKLKMLINGASR